MSTYSSSISLSVTIRIALVLAMIAATVALTAPSADAAVTDLTGSINAPATAPRGGSIDVVYTINNPTGSIESGHTLLLFAWEGFADPSEEFVVNDADCGAGGTFLTGLLSPSHHDCALPDIPANGSIDFTVTWDIDPTTPIRTETFGAAAWDGEWGIAITFINATVAVFGDTDVEEGADLEITKSDDADPAYAGDELTYTVEVTNNGPDTAVNPIVTDTLPAGLTFVSASPDDGSACDNTIECELNDISNGDTVVITIVADIDPTHDAQLSNTASVTNDTADYDDTNNSETEITDVVREAALSIEKTGDAEVVAGENVTWTITVGNDGPSTAGVVVVDDNLPDDLVFVSATPDSGTCNAADPIQCDLGDMAPGEAIDIEIVATVPADYVLDSFQNTATVDGEWLDAGDNESSWVTDVIWEADISVGKTGPGTVAQGSNGTWTVTVTNDGPSIAWAVSIEDLIEAGQTLVSATPSVGSCNPGSPVICYLGAILPGDSETVDIVVTFNELGAAENSVDAYTRSDDPNEQNNSYTAGATVEEQLPDTGVDTDRLMLSGFAMLLFGAFILLFSRKREELTF